MPPIKKHRDFQPIHFRFTHKSETDLESFIKFLLSYSVKTLTVFEDADLEVNRAHTHTIIFVNETLNNFRKQFKKKFSDYGRGDYGSCIIESLEKMERYVCKGKDRRDPPDYRLIKEYEQTHLEQRHNEYWDENNKLIHQSVKNVKPKKITWMEDVNLYIREQYPEDIFGKWEYNSTGKRIVYDIVMQKLGKLVKKISPKIIRELCDGQLNNLCGYEVRKDYWSQVFPEEDRYHPYT